MALGARPLGQLPQWACRWLRFRLAWPPAQAPRRRVLLSPPASPRVRPASPRATSNRRPERTANPQRKDNAASFKAPEANDPATDVAEPTTRSSRGGTENGRRERKSVGKGTRRVASVDL